jgi:hypothetical protein
MRIGILTYHWVYNFGANLQVLSTVCYLKNNGFDPLVINWIPRDLELKYDQNIPLAQAIAHQNFQKELLPCSQICRSETEIVSIIDNENLQAVIIGSDAVLQHSTIFSRIHLRRNGIVISPKPGTDVLFPNPFWGSFIPYLKEKLPIVVMSASSQHSEFMYIRGRLRKKIGSSLKLFSSITVRDEWTAKMIKYLTRGAIVPTITPDPVFAFNQNVEKQYSKVEILKKFNLPDRYILFSFKDKTVVTKDWLNSFQLIANENNLKCVALTMPNGIKFEHPFFIEISSPLCPMEWYGIIKYSSGYIGQNMHPIIVALHNSVPFFSFDPYGIVKYKFFVKGKSSKIYDILFQSGYLKNRISNLGRSYKCPSPQEVFFRIKDFDTVKCSLFSISQLDRYNFMMNNLTSFRVI